jgi:hypothetical protein
MFKCMWSNNIARAVASNNADIVRDTMLQFRDCGHTDLFGPAFVQAKTAALSASLESMHVTQLLAALAQEDAGDARAAVRHLHADGFAQSPEAAVEVAERAAALFVAQAQELARRWLLREAEVAFGPLTGMHALAGNVALPGNGVSAGSHSNPATPPRAAGQGPKHRAAAVTQQQQQQQQQQHHHKYELPPTPTPHNMASPSRRWGELPPNADYYG